MKKILIIEDDAGLSRGISFALFQEGYETVAAENIKTGWQQFRAAHPDAVLLDLNLPDGDGMDLCRTIRKESKVPVLMLTARDLELDEVMGLKSGADDYLTKPFSLSVLKVRLELALRRQVHAADGEADTPKLCSGDVSLHPGKARAWMRGKELDLSLTEFRLLQYFLENKNQVLLKEQILQHIWDDDGNFVEENTLFANISRLRKKVGSGCIKTIYGMGYLWEE